ncbi:hypothetical protein DFH09DRAFT_1068765 [Mycena vulgaris]|nr:hypothetical protein DFH09DRAFT_1068765 [Mycena vulgaris]
MSSTSEGISAEIELKKVPQRHVRGWNRTAAGRVESKLPGISRDFSDCSLSIDTDWKEVKNCRVGPHSIRARHYRFDLPASLINAQCWIDSVNRKRTNPGVDKSNTSNGSMNYLARICAADAARLLQ